MDTGAWMRLIYGCLLAGDAHFEKLEHRSAERSLLLQQLKVAQFFRLPRAEVSSIDREDLAEQTAM
jgi:hypothetical protein